MNQSMHGTGRPPSPDDSEKNIQIPGGLPSGNVEVGDTQSGIRGVTTEVKLDIIDLLNLPAANDNELADEETTEEKPEPKTTPVPPTVLPVVRPLMEEQVKVEALPPSLGAKVKSPKKPRLNIVDENGKRKRRPRDPNAKPATKPSKLDPVTQRVVGVEPAAKTTKIVGGKIGTTIEHDERISKSFSAKNRGRMHADYVEKIAQEVMMSFQMRELVAMDYKEKGPITVQKLMDLHKELSTNERDEEENESLFPILRRKVAKILLEFFINSSGDTRYRQFLNNQKVDSIVQAVLDPDTTKSKMASIFGNFMRK